MAKTYLSNKTRAQHTYAFFKNRKDDPEWHDEFIRIRGIRRREKLIQTVIGLITIVVLFVGWHGYKAVTAGNNIVPSADKVVTSSYKISKPEKDSVVDESSTESDNGDVSDSSSVDKSSNESSSSNEQSSNQDKAKNVVFDQLVGKKFAFVPVKYDGIAVDKAMDENKAPQNTVHDSHFEGTFINDKEVNVKYAMSTNSVVDRYTVGDNAIVIGGQRIPYTLDNGRLSIPTWEEKTNDGHILTKQFRLN